MTNGTAAPFGYEHPSTQNHIQLLRVAGPVPPSIDVELRRVESCTATTAASTTTSTTVIGGVCSAVSSLTTSSSTSFQLPSNGRGSSVPAAVAPANYCPLQVAASSLALPPLPTSQPHSRTPSPYGRGAFTPTLRAAASASPAALTTANEGAELMGMRFGERGRALRKSAAVEDEDQLALTVEVPSSSSAANISSSSHGSHFSHHSPQPPTTAGTIMGTQLLHRGGGAASLLLDYNLATLSAQLAAGAMNQGGVNPLALLPANYPASAAVLKTEQGGKNGRLTPTQYPPEYGLFTASREEVLQALLSNANVAAAVAAASREVGTTTGAHAPPWLLSAAGVPPPPSTTTASNTSAFASQLQSFIMQSSVEVEGLAATEGETTSRMASSSATIHVCDEQRAMRQQMAELSGRTTTAATETTRNPSTESTGSTIPGTLAVEGIPRKQDIQTDIRMNRGRFRLQRKRGRSEVWNLFGQVVDTLTGQRLPYVACYACKVLYTDTGGGTGNMTRHRCSVGSSYRSHTESLETGGTSYENQSSSFESAGQRALSASPSQEGPSDASAPPLPLQPDGPKHLTLVSPRVSSVQRSREAFAAQSTSGNGDSAASSGFISGGSLMSANVLSSASIDSVGCFSFGGGLMAPVAQPTSLLPLPSGAPHPAVVSQQASPLCLSSQTLQYPRPLHITHQQQQSLLNVLHSAADTARPSSVSPGQKSAPRVKIAAPPCSGYMFSQHDKQLFVHAMVQFCSQSFHNYDIVEGEGFKSLIETVLFIGRRSHGEAASAAVTSFDSVRNLIPSANQLKQIFSAQENYVRKATMSDLESASDSVTSLTCSTLSFDGKDYAVVRVNYITEDWHLTRRALSVTELEPSINLDLLIGQTLRQNCERCAIMLAFDRELERRCAGRTDAVPNAFISRNINLAIDSIVRECLEEAAIGDGAVHGEGILAFIKLCNSVVKRLEEVDDRAGTLPTELATRLQHMGRSKNTQLTKHRNDGIVDTEEACFDSVEKLYTTIRLTREYRDTIAEHLSSKTDPLSAVDWAMASELETFLESFNEAVQIFKDEKQLHFHRILPEWSALIHECRPPSERLVEKGNDERPTPSVVVKREEGEETLFPSSGREGVRHPFNYLGLLRHLAYRRLKEWAGKHILVEHKVATALNPRLKHLNLIVDDHCERTNVYKRIRELIGLTTKPQRGKFGSSSSTEEPAKKRRCEFLDRLEDCAVAEDDELDEYLRASFQPNQTRNVLEFWSSVGERQFPNLARLARFLLATPAAPEHVSLPLPSSRLEANGINTLLILTPEVLNSLSRSRSCSAVVETRLALPHPK